MHMLGRKDLNLAELETVRVSRNPTTVVTANGEVQTIEETVFVHDLDIFVTVQVLGVTLAVPLLGRLCEDQRSKTTSHPQWQKNPMQH